MTTQTLIPVKTNSEIISDIGNMASADNGFVVLDIEGDEKDVRADPNSITLGFSYAYRLRTEMVSGYIPIHHYAHNVPSEYIETFKAIAKVTPNFSPICHNIKYDLVGFKNDLGIDLLDCNFYCTMLMAHMVDENLPNKGLDYVSKVYGGKPKNKTDAQKKLAEAFGWELVPINLMYDYSTNDSIITYELFEKLLKQCKKEFPNWEELWTKEREWVRFIIAVEACGVSLDHDFIRKEIEIGDRRLDAIRDELGGNPGSPKFLATLLFEKLGLPIVKTTPKGKPCFDKEAMAKYEEMLEERAIHEEDNELENESTAAKILEYRGWQKTVSSNYRAYLELESPDKRLRPNYKIHGTTSTRLSCEKPNLQQIPRESDKRWNGHLKKAFIPQEGYRLWEFDYSNLELRIMAVYAEQENLLKALRQGLKPFDVMAEQLVWPRQNVKTFVYMTGYGAGIDKIARTFMINSNASQTMREEYFTQYPGFKDFANDARDRANMRGYVKLWTGRRCHFPYVYVEDVGKKVRIGTHKAMNRIVQGGGAELVKHAGIAVGKKIDWNECTINLQIHDSYVAEIKKGTEDKWIPIIKETMEDVGSYCTDFAVCPFPVETKEWAA